MAWEHISYLDFEAWNWIWIMEQREDGAIYPLPGSGLSQPGLAWPEHDAACFHGGNTVSFQHFLPMPILGTLFFWKGLVLDSELSTGYPGLREFPA